MSHPDYETYRDWLYVVNELIKERTGGFGIDDLADAPTRSFYRDGLDPEDAAEDIILNDGTFA
jgi:hypothetical protein